MLLPRPPLGRPPRPRDPDENDPSRAGGGRPLPPEYASKTISVPRAAAAAAVQSESQGGGIPCGNQNYTVPRIPIQAFFLLMLKPSEFTNCTKVRSHTEAVATARPLGKGCIGGATIMQSHVMTKRRSEVGVAALRPLALNRATSEILPSRGTLFLKGESTKRQEMRAATHFVLLRCRDV